jgi:hypothetical protein
MSSDFTRHPESRGKDHVKVHFDLVRDEGGYPPVSSEMIWAIPFGESRFCLDNIPFFVYGVSCFDIVLARQEASGQLKYDRLIEPSGHSTIRVIVYDQPADPRPLNERVSVLRKNFRELGCASELSHMPSLISIDIPPEVALVKAKFILDNGEKQGLWGYEEATVAHAQ